MLQIIPACSLAIGMHSCWSVDDLKSIAHVYIGPIINKFGEKCQESCVRPCSHCRSCAGTVPICRISGVCERAMSAIKLDLISENLIRSREGSVFRHNYLCRNKCNMNAAYTYVGERWRCRLDIINVVIVNGSQSNYL